MLELSWRLGVYPWSRSSINETDSALKYMLLDGQCLSVAKSLRAHLTEGPILPRFEEEGGTGSVDISYAAPQAHRIVNVALYREYSPGIIFIFFQGRKDLYHV
jgi:hypothetical protein